MKEEAEVDNFAVSLGISRSELDARKVGFEEGRKEEREKLPPKAALGGSRNRSPNVLFYLFP